MAGAPWLRRRYKHWGVTAQSRMRRCPATSWWPPPSSGIFPAFSAPDSPRQNARGHARPKAQASGNDEHRGLAVAQEKVRDAAEQQACRPAQPPPADDDQIGLGELDVGENLIGGIAIACAHPGGLAGLGQEPPGL